VTARTLMVQGTTSNAGKSLLVTALCRWLVRQGVWVAPFKPQNMALNSAVTADGGEIGRAQALQAITCQLKPRIDMNPVLLKPNTDTGAQVVVRGHAVGNMDARRYHAYKGIARTEVFEAYRRLASRFDAVIVEGAGSPAEINLRADDIANMGFAEAVDCPVILIADIELGGYSPISTARWPCCRKANGPAPWVSSSIGFAVTWGSCSRGWIGWRKTPDGKS